MDILTGKPLGTVGIYMGIPRFGSLELSRGMWRFWRSRSLAAVVAYYLVDLYDDVFGYAGLYGIAIDHLSEVDALLVRLSDRHLAEDFIFSSNHDADEITRNVCFPCCEFLQCDDITWHDDWCK